MCSFVSNMLLPTITSFQIRTVNGHTTVYPIADLCKLTEFIQDKGLAEIAKVSFYFEDPVLYGVILRQEEERMFVPDFMPGIPESRKRLDIQTVREAVNTIPELDPVFGKLIKFIEE